MFERIEQLRRDVLARPVCATLAGCRAHVRAVQQSQLIFPECIAFDATADELAAAIWKARKEFNSEFRTQNSGLGI